MDTDHGGQMADQMPHQGRVTTIGQVSRVVENGLNENGQMVPEHEIETEALNLQSLAQALPTSNQLRTTNRPAVTITQVCFPCHTPVCFVTLLTEIHSSTSVTAAAASLFASVFTGSSPTLLLRRTSTPTSCLP